MYYYHFWLDGCFGLLDYESFYSLSRTWIDILRDFDMNGRHSRTSKRGSLQFFKLGVLVLLAFCLSVLFCFLDSWCLTLWSVLSEPTRVIISVCTDRVFHVWLCYYCFFMCIYESPSNNSDIMGHKIDM